MLRVYLNEKGVIPSPEGDLERVLKELGISHERNHLSTFPDLLDLTDMPFGEKVKKTEEEVFKRTKVIYQPAFSLSFKIEEFDISLMGQPDFLIHEDEGYIIRDCKLSRRVDDHPEIVKQLGLYCFLYKKTFPTLPFRLEVFAGDRSLVPVDYLGDEEVIRWLNELSEIKTLREKPYSPVGWSKCIGCGYRNICWREAEKKKDVALIPGVSQSIALTLKEMGIDDYDTLAESISVEELSKVKVPRGNGMAKIGKKSEEIIHFSEAISKGKEIVLGKLKVPESANYVIFDLEGLPPYLDELDKIYLWGMKVVGEEPSGFIPSLAGFGDAGDREGWEMFLQNCKKIFKKYGFIPFIHWASYERTKVRNYIERYGDPGGIGAKVLECLFDLLPAVKQTVVLPLYSYSLKVIEEYVGYTRSMKEYGGDWAIAKYIEAIETEEDELREKITGDISKYNEEDLDATWEVLKWLKKKFG